MFDILSLLQCLLFHLDEIPLRQLSIVITALLAMSGRVTMLGISRWAGKGGSYRTVQRLFSTPLPWPRLFWEFFRQHCWCRTHTYLVAGDEVVTTKSGKHTYGLGRFFSSLYDQPVLGLDFFELSLVSVEQRHAFPIRTEQVLRQDSKLKPAGASKGKPGRPRGSKNQDKTEFTLNAELLQIRGMITALLALISGLFSLNYLLLDGKYGNNNAMQMARQVRLHLISKLRHDSELYLPYQGPNRRRKYGERLSPRHMSKEFLVDSSNEDGVLTEIYQVKKALHKKFAHPLNIVIIVKTNLKTQAQAHVILFSSDLSLGYELLIDYYSLRFQIEFNFRDAKQFWGLEDFMNTTETGVTNAANLSLFMVNVSHRLLRDFRQNNPLLSVLDLKAAFRGYKYVEEVLKLLPQKPDPISMASIFAHVANLGAIHPISSSKSA
jgi:putative transposase